MLGGLLFVKEGDVVGKVKLCLKTSGNIFCRKVKFGCRSGWWRPCIGDNLSLASRPQLAMFFFFYPKHYSGTVGFQIIAHRNVSDHY